MPFTASREAKELTVLCGQYKEPLWLARSLTCCLFGPDPADKVLHWKEQQFTSELKS